MYFDERIAIFQMQEVETIKQILNENNLNIKREVKTRLKEFKREYRQEMGEAGLDEDWRKSREWMKREEEVETKHCLTEELKKEFEERERKLREKERRVESSEWQVVGLLGQAKMQVELKIGRAHV